MGGKNKVLFAAVEFIMVLVVNFLPAFSLHDDSMQFTSWAFDVTRAVNAPAKAFEIFKLRVN